MSNLQYKNSEIKSRISEKLEISVLESSKLAQAITKSSRTREILHQCTKTFVGLDNTISSTDQSLQSLQKSYDTIDLKSDQLHKCLKQVEHLKNHTNHILNSVK